MADEEPINWATNPPSENLRLEFKAWIDPASPRDKAKIVRALLALRNRNGGSLIIGIDDKTSSPLPDPPYDVRSTFHADVVQSLVSLHASDPFEVRVKFLPIGRIEYPEIIVQRGVRIPVAVKRGIVEGNHTFLQNGEVPFRTTRASGDVSSAACQPADWGELVDICFENREADIARFLRRHFGDAGIEGVLSALSPAAMTKSVPSDDAVDALNWGHERLMKRLDESGFPDGKHGHLSWGGLEAGVVISPALTNFVADRRFLNIILDSVPALTGLQSWPDTRNWSELATKPDVQNGVWETLLDVYGLWKYLGFSIIDPSGRFYTWRSFDDDASANQFGHAVQMFFDPLQATKQIIEVIASALILCRALKTANADHALHFAFRWRNLKGRELWGHFNSALDLTRAFKAASDMSSAITVTVPADLALTALGPIVMKVATPMLVTFSGYSLAPYHVEESLRIMLSRANLA